MSTATPSRRIAVRPSEVTTHGRHLRPSRARRKIALIAGLLTLAVAAALPTAASAIIINGTPDSFSGIGVTRSLELLSISAFEDPALLGGFHDPNIFVASWRPAATATTINMQLACVNVAIGRTQSTVYASGRSSITGEYFTLQATDGGLGGPDTFAVKRHSTAPAGYRDPSQVCGARDLVMSAVVSGELVAIGDPDI